MTTILRTTPMTEEEYDKGMEFADALAPGTERQSTYEDYVGSFEAPPSGPSKFDQANEYVLNHLVGLNNVGTTSLLKPRAMKAAGSLMTEVFNDEPISDEDSLPLGPGNTYLTHLFNFHQLPSKIRKNKQAQKGTNIYTDQQEALRTALKVVGCYSEKNPGGMPIDIHEAKKFWFGEKGADPEDEAEFYTSVEGDHQIDPKRVRRFTNFDGSLTWEILNDDKTVMNRFTIGSYKGTKVFAQGGYKKFSELLKQVRAKLGKDTGAEFEAIRTSFGS